MATNTAASFTNHTGNGTAGPFSISFSYLSEAEVDVTVGGVLKTITTHYTFTSATQITFTSGNEPGNGVAIKFQRDTDISAKKVDFQDGSVLTETDLDTNADQVLFAQQEITDKLGGIEENATADQTAAEIRTLVESATDSNVFTDADHTKLNGIEAAATADQTAAEIRTLVESASDSNVFTDADHTKLNGIEASATADQTAAEIRTLVESATDSNVFTDADHTKLDGIETGATADQTVTEIKSLIAGSPLDASHLAANSVDSSELVDGSVDTSHLSADCVDSTKIADNAIGSEHLQANSVGTSEIADAELTTLAGMQSGTASKLADSTALTADLADLNQLDGMAKQTTITDDDTKFPTSGAVVDFVAAQIAPIGGLEVIANEDSFPTTQPASGVVISISDIEGLIVNGSGVATNARTSGNGSDNVTINGFPSSLQSKTMAAGLGLMVSSTGSSQTYTYHKLLAKEADVEQLSNDINDFAARYRVGSSNPSTDLDAGDLFFNTSTSKLLVYNATNSAWEEAQSIGNFFISTFSESVDGSRQDFTVSNAPANAQQILLSINGVVQKPNSGTSTPSEGFALSGSTVKLAAAPPSGSDIFIVVMGSTVNIGTPSDNTVTTAILQNGSVTTAKIANDAVTQAKIADDAVGADQLASSAVVTASIVDANVTTAKIGDDQVTAAKISNNEDFTINSVTVGKGANSVAGNTVLGEGALDASVSGGNNTAIGKDALTALTSGTNNTAVGYRVLTANTTGVQNTAVGADALGSNTTGEDNTAVGYLSMYTNSTGQRNTAMGRDALRLNTTGSFNTTIGHNSLENNTTANNNTAIGYEALKLNTTGASNTAIGPYTLDANTTANNNVGIGVGVLTDNTTGASNTSIGDDSLANNTTASNNTAVGKSALFANTTGASLVAVGEGALKANTTASGNTGLGKDALESNTTGDNNVAVGGFAMNSNTTGTANTAIGQEALDSNTTASGNTAVGRHALGANTTGAENDAFGFVALASNTTGGNNCAFGAGALDANTTASNNSAFGRDALGANTTGGTCTAVGTEALKRNTTGHDNTCIGYRAGQYIQSSGRENTIVGGLAGDSLTTGVNNVCIGYDSEPSSSTSNNSVTLGNQYTTDLRCNDTSISSLSDQRDKTEIIDLPIGLDFINAVRPVKFKWASRDGKQGKDGTYEAGFIAQEFQAVETATSVDYLRLVLADNPDKLEAAPNKLFPVLVKAIQELSAKVTALEAG